LASIRLALIRFISYRSYEKETCPYNGKRAVSP
jgi:hypothetical protein